MKKDVYAYLHTHWDREWYREFEEFRVRLIEVTDDILNKLEKNEVDAFYFDGQTGALKDYLEIKPENVDRIKALVKSKKLFVGPYYCSTDSLLVDSESIIKNLQMGIKDSEEYGCKDFIAYHADTFGHSSYIPQIIKYFNIKNAVFWRGLGELESEFLFRNLKSEYLIEGYFHDYFSANVSFEQKAKMLKRTLDRISKYSGENILLPLGADHLTPPDNIKEQIKEVNKLLEDYKIILSTPFEYLKKVEKNYKKNITHEFRDTKRNFILPGVYSSRIDLKQQNSINQWKLARQIQPLHAVLSFLGKTKNFQSEIDYAYKLLIDNQPHDSIYGCSVDNVHKENKIRSLKLSEIINALNNSIQRDLYNEEEFSAINLSNFDFQGALKISTTKKLSKNFNAQLIGTRKGFPLTRLYRTNEIPVTEDYTNIYDYLVDLKKIKALSSKKLTNKDINNVSTLRITDKSIENSHIQLSVSGCKINIKDKESNTQYKNILEFMDRADIGDSYNFGALYKDKPLSAKIKKSKILKKGHIKSTLRIIFEINIPSSSEDKGRSNTLKKHTLFLDVTLGNQNDYLEFCLHWENKSKNHILQVKFNLPEKITETYSDDLAGYTKREFETDYDIYKYIPAPRGIELKLNTAPIQKFLLVQNIGLVTEGLQEYEVFKNELRLTLLRATGTISNPHNPTRGTPAGPPLPTPDLQMIGKNHARFALCFKKDIHSLEETSEKFYNTAFLLNANLESESYFSSGNKNILVSTIKTDKNNDLIIRFINMSNNRQKFSFKTSLPHNGIYYIDAMENITKKYKNSVIEGNSFVAVLLKNYGQNVSNSKK